MAHAPGFATLPLMLFDPAAHEPLLDAPWEPAEVEVAIRTIARDADDALLGAQWWPLHRSTTTGGRRCLCTGDVGAALYLRGCLEGSSDVPTIDVW